MKKLILAFFVGFAAIAATQAQSTYENYDITTLQPTVKFKIPEGVAVDQAGNLYVADNAAIFRITSSGQATVYAGTPG